MIIYLKGDNNVKFINFNCKFIKNIICSHIAANSLFPYSCICLLYSFVTSFKLLRKPLSKDSSQIKNLPLDMCVIDIIILFQLQVFIYLLLDILYLKLIMKVISDDILQVLPLFDFKFEIMLNFDQ